MVKEVFTKCAEDSGHGTIRCAGSKPPAHTKHLVAVFYNSAATLLYDGYETHPVSWDRERAMAVWRTLDAARSGRVLPGLRQRRANVLATFSG